MFEGTISYQSPSNGQSLQTRGLGDCSFIVRHVASLVQDKNRVFLWFLTGPLSSFRPVSRTLLRGFDRPGNENRDEE